MTQRKGWGGIRNPAIDERLLTVIEGRTIHHIPEDSLQRLITANIARALQFEVAIIRKYTKGEQDDDAFERLYLMQEVNWKCAQTCIEELERRGVSAMYLPLYKLIHRRDEW